MDPKIIEITEQNDILKFTLSGVNVSLANALRRIILSDIPCNVIRTETFEENQCNVITNTTRLHNEILKQRLSCIPIHTDIHALDLLPNNYVLEVKVKNDTDAMMFVTTEHFKLKNKENDHYVTENETRKIFPPNNKTGAYIDFARLRPKVSDSIPGEELHLVAEFSIGNAKLNSMFNVVSKCAYGNTPDLEQVDAEWKKRKDQLVKENNTNEQIEFHKKNFYLLDAQRYYKENSYDFVIKSVGVYENKTIVKKGIKILQEKVKKFSDEEIQILNSDVTMDNCFDVYLHDEDYTLGKVLEYLLYEKYYMGNKQLSFCGFKKLHPHDPYSIIRMAFVEKVDKSVVKQLLQNVSGDANGIFQKMYDLF